MSFSELLKNEILKTKRSKLAPLLFIAPLLVVISGIANISSYFTPEYPNPWAAMFIQSALLYAYYLLPLSLIVVCAMLAGRESSNNGIQKMLALPVNLHALSLAKFCILVGYLIAELLVFLVVFVLGGLYTTASMNITQTLPFLDLLKWCGGLLLTMLPALSAMWAITVLFEKPLLSVGLNLFLVLPGVLMANTPLWILYPYCYSGYLISCSLHEFSNSAAEAAFTWFPFAPFAVAVFAILLGISVIYFGKKEMRS